MDRHKAPTAHKRGEAGIGRGHGGNLLLVFGRSGPVRFCDGQTFRDLEFLLFRKSQLQDLLPAHGKLSEMPGIFTVRSDLTLSADDRFWNQANGRARGDLGRQRSQGPRIAVSALAGRVLHRRQSASGQTKPLRDRLVSGNLRRKAGRRKPTPSGSTARVPSVRFQPPGERGYTTRTHRAPRQNHGSLDQALPDAAFTPPSSDSVASSTSA
jgi:hypothetical protein